MAKSDEDEKRKLILNDHGFKSYPDNVPHEIFGSKTPIRCRPD